MEDIYKIAEPFFNEQCKTVFVTSDGNVFYEKGYAEYHGDRTDGKLYTVDAKTETPAGETPIVDEPTIEDKPAVEKIDETNNSKKAK